jgi:hypothetical protein
MAYDQRGQKVNNQVNINIESSEKKFFQQGINALRNKNYSFAIGCFEKSFNDEDKNAESEKHFYLALALLGGSRPRLHSFSSIQTIEEQLRLAINSNPKYSKACVLWAIVKYDYYVMNRMSEKPPLALDLVNQGYAITRNDIAELLSHIQASDNEIWEWMNSRR